MINPRKLDRYPCSITVNTRPRSDHDAVLILVRPPGSRLRPSAVLARAAQAPLGWPADPRWHCAGLHAGAAAIRPERAGAVAGYARHNRRAYRGRLVESALRRSHPRPADRPIHARPGDP